MAQTSKSLPVLQSRSSCCQQAERILDPSLFRALGDPSRLSVLCRLIELGEPSTVSQVACCCPLDLSVVSRHLAQLRLAGVAAAEKRGKEVRYRVLYASLARTLRAMADAIEACCPSDDDGVDLPVSGSRLAAP